MAVPRNTPACTGEPAKKWPATNGYNSMAAQPKSTTQVTANAVSAWRARITGDIATTAVQPHTAVPIASRIPRRRGTREQAREHDAAGERDAQTDERHRQRGRGDGGRAAEREAQPDERDADAQQAVHGPVEPRARPRGHADAVAPQHAEHDGAHDRT